jgi:hypothetical protein
MLTHYPTALVVRSLLACQDRQPSRPQRRAFLEKGLPLFFAHVHPPFMQLTMIARHSEHHRPHTHTAKQHTA